MASPDTLLKPQALEQMTQVFEPDGCIGCAAQNPPKDLVRCHAIILPIDFGTYYFTDSIIGISRFSRPFTILPSGTLLLAALSAR